MYYVYILKNCKDSGLYYGYTNNLERRIAEHKNKQNCELIYYEGYKSEFGALAEKDF
ncbi:MAG: GIY-YIG nuclease family protein [Candidatus Omnitrophota bacterium]